MSLDDLRDRLACPLCRGRLSWSVDTAACSSCPGRFEIEEDGIPVLLPEPLERNLHKRAQASAHDQTGIDPFEESRPRGASRFYGLLMEEKLDRGLRGLESMLHGSTAVVVCAGSGMDAELLARRGARVVAVDISVGACRRTLARARAGDLPILPVVGDAEALPLADASADLAFVHDGLHHLEDYFGGLLEMARVADRAVSVTEPAAARATVLAVTAGISMDVEESGNDVRRESLAAVVEQLRRYGFDPIDPHRYAMYYAHEPGAVVRLLSRRRLSRFALGGFRLANRIIGRLGNKMAIQAVRAPRR